MSFSPKKTVVGAILVVVALGLFLIIKPDESKNEDPGTRETPVAVTGPSGATSAKPKTKEPAPPRRPSAPVFEVKDGQPVGGVQKLEVNEGDDVRFTVKSDAEEEVHVHGFDVSEPVGPGKPARFDFKAGFTGIFEVELEHSAVPIIELQVNP